MTSALNIPKYQLNVSFLTILWLLLLVLALIQGEDDSQVYSGGVLFPINEKEELKLLSNAKLISHKDESIPDSFDVKEKWPQCESIGRIRDEGDCGFSWALALVGVMTDRLCIASNGTDELEFSVEDLITCCHDCGVKDEDNLCDAGENLIKTLEYMQKHGVVSGGDINSNKGCKPTSTNTITRSDWATSKDKCTRICSKNYGSPYKTDKRRITDIKYEYSLKNRKEIQTEIMKNGPVMAVIRPPEEFRDNTTEDIYKFSKEGANYPLYYHGKEYRPGYYHAVRVCGWGSKDDQPYWNMANSYGYSWGDRGYFRYAICESSDDCGPVEGEKHLSVVAVAGFSTSSCSNEVKISTCMVTCIMLSLIKHRNH